MHIKKIENMNQKIYVAGHRGMVGSAIVRNLRVNGYSNIVTKTHKELDLTNQSATQSFFETEKPDQVYLAAAKVGGIHANNTFPAEFIYQNLMIQSNVIHHSFVNGVKKLLFLGSSCIYPKLADQPMKEGALLTGKLEPTNEPYAIAKIAGIKLCESYNRQYGSTHGIDYRSVMPTNLYGPGDNYHSENSHVIPGLIRRFHEAKVKNLDEVTVWGTGAPIREFLYVDDMASASIYVMEINKEHYKQYVEPMQGHINVGAGSQGELSISDLAEKIAKTVGFKGKILFDPLKPDGTYRKLMDSRQINALGWSPSIDIDRGLQLTYLNFLKSYALLSVS
jgi:GDP-L-fucose synthase